MDGNGETTMFHVNIWNDPTETTTKNWLCQVPGMIYNASKVERFGRWLSEGKKHWKHEVSNMFNLKKLTKTQEKEKGKRFEKTKTKPKIEQLIP